MTANKLTIKITHGIVLVSPRQKSDVSGISSGERAQKVATTCLGVKQYDTPAFLRKRETVLEVKLRPRSVVLSQRLSRFIWGGPLQDVTKLHAKFSMECNIEWTVFVMSLSGIHSLVWINAQAKEALLRCHRDQMSCTLICPTRLLRIACRLQANLCVFQQNNRFLALW